MRLNKRNIRNELKLENQHLEIETMHNNVSAQNTKLKKLLGQKKSSEILTGHISEKLAPLTTAFKYNTRDAVFMGMPIDYLVFDENAIVFLEIKSGNSQLTTKQKAIKKLVEAKKVKWDMVRITGDEDICSISSDLESGKKLEKNITKNEKE